MTRPILQGDENFLDCSDALSLAQTHYSDLTDESSPTDEKHPPTTWKTPWPQQEFVIYVCWGLTGDLIYLTKQRHPSPDMI